ncbi:flagellin N-terminal helical domain-containing protein [Swingsia samuiensis]|uniref:Flagellin n=1 Tax=Swingsia samuiensis TaxID=1293412 RepID=A0A4Y6UKR3_9PROT|nr:flagellin [Swingsia samuiensis]QDH17066.1 flagellin B [Swingsia samuiensis]
MTMSINTNTASLAALQTLSQTTDALNKTENAISTGKKVNNAADNPAIYSISQSMNANISSLSGVSTGLQLAGQVVNTATKQTQQISSILANIASTVTNSANKAEDEGTLNHQISSYLTQINTSAQNATFQGVNLLAGSTDSNIQYTNISAAQDANGNLFTQAGSNATAIGLGLQNLSTKTKGATLDFSKVTAFTTTGAKATTLTLQNYSATSGNGTGGNPSVTSSFVLDDQTGGNLASTDALAAALGTAVSAATGTKGTVTVNPDGSLASTAIKSQSTASDGTVTYDIGGGKNIIASTDASGNMTYSVSTAIDSNGNATNITKIVDVNTSSSATETGSQKLNDETSSLMNAMDNAGFGVSRSNSNVLTIAGGNLDAASVSASSLSNITGTVAASTTSGTAVVQLAVKAAINTMNSVSDNLGVATNTISQLQTSNSALSDALTTGVGALTDADLAAESAKLTSLQTKQQLAIQSLSIANSQSSNIMSLFRS